jgi:hypothetical protein
MLQTSNPGWLPHKVRFVLANFMNDRVGGKLALPVTGSSKAVALRRERFKITSWCLISNVRDDGAPHPVPSEGPALQISYSLSRGEVAEKVPSH